MCVRLWGFSLFVSFCVHLSFDIWHSMHIIITLHYSTPFLLHICEILFALFVSNNWQKTLSFALSKTEICLWTIDNVSNNCYSFFIVRNIYYRCRLFQLWLSVIIIVAIVLLLCVIHILICLNIKIFANLTRFYLRLDHRRKFHS